MQPSQEYRPALAPRRGEGIAWLVTLGLVVSLILAGHRWGPVPGSYWALAGLFGLAASAISLSNWVDRRSVIRLDAEGISFENGLRSVRLTWPEVQQVAVFPTRLGRRVQVCGARSSFGFQMAAEIRLGERTIQTGFVGGQAILETILERCGLDRRVERNGVTYYGRLDGTLR